MDGRVTTYRNDFGDQVLAVCNTKDGNVASLGMTQNEIAEVMAMLDRGGWQ